MPIEWTGLGPELLLRLDRKLGEPIGAQLERALREAICAGRLASHERLPSSRALARALGLSRGLVIDCYAQLQAEGYLITRGGSSTRVARVDAASSMPPVRAAPQLAVDFRPGVPDLASFPRRDWLAALREACRTISAAALGYADPRGDLQLREVIAAYLRRVRGCAAAPDGIAISAGFAQGVNLALRALARAGVRRVAVEDPGDPDQGIAVRRAGLEAVPIAVDDGGIDVDALARDGAIQAVILTPAHQFPTGGVLAPARRRALIRWATARGATILEDDYDAEFRYDRAPVSALQGEAPDRVITLGSVSKSLAPALRLGWMVCPPRLIDAIADDKRRDDRGSPAIDQRALAHLIESGRYDRHLRAMRAIYTRRRAALVAALARHAPAVELTGLAAGLHAVARLPDGIDAAAAIAAARARSVGLYDLADYRIESPSHRGELVIGFGNATEEAIERGIAAIADLLQPPARRPASPSRRPAERRTRPGARRRSR